MNYKVFFVLAVGLTAMAILFFIPPWKAHGVYAGHFRVDRVAWMEFDTTRFYVEESAIALVMALAIIKTRIKKRELEVSRGDAENNEKSETKNRK